MLIDATVASGLASLDLTQHDVVVYLAAVVLSDASGRLDLAAHNLTGICRSTPRRIVRSVNQLTARGLVRAVEGSTVDVVPVGKAAPPADETTPVFQFPPAFEAFWAAYPKRTGKGEAFRRWQAAVKAAGGGRKAEAFILDAATRFAASMRIYRTEARYIPLPATWLNQARYLDALEEPRGGAKLTGYVPMGNGG